MVFEDAVRMLMFEGWCSEEVSCLKRTVSVWLSVMTDADFLETCGFYSDGPPVDDCLSFFSGGVTM